MGAKNKDPLLVSAKSLRSIGAGILEKRFGPTGAFLIYVLMVILLLAILVIVAINLAWIKPTHRNSDEIVEIVRTIDENTDDPGTDINCSDFNPCTKDECRFGACDHRPFKNDHPCETPCFGGETSCQNGQCLGSCPDPNNCQNDGQCPDIAKIGGGNFDKECKDQKCLWKITDVPPVLQGTCSHGNHGQDDLFSDACRACVSKQEPLRNCLSIHTFCPVVAPNNNLEDLNCIFHFNCSHYDKLII